VLERFAARQPVLLALDDVHWADPASFDVIAHLLRRFRGPLLVALAFRQTPARLASALDGSFRLLRPDLPVFAGDGGIVAWKM
jgi:predicted ATPase